MKDSSEFIDQQLVRVHQRARTFWSWSQTTSTRLPEITVVAVVAVGILFLTRSSWFFGDDWKFLIVRRDLWDSGQYFEAIFVPHNEHLSAVPAVVYLVFEAIFGIGSMLPYFAVLIAGHVAVLWAARTIMIRLKVPMPWRIVGLIWLGFFGAGDAEFFHVDDHDVIAGVHVGGKFRLVLAAQEMSDFGGEPTEHLVGGVNQIPIVHDLLRFG
jgi:hypothetical protein